MSERKLVTEADIAIINNQCESGKPMIISSNREQFVETVNSLLRKDKWKVPDTRWVKTYITNGYKDGMDYIFTVMNDHALYKKLFCTGVKVVNE